MYKFILAATASIVGGLVVCAISYCIKKDFTFYPVSNTKPAVVEQTRIGPVSMEAEKLAASMEALDGWRIDDNGYTALVNDKADLFVDHRGIVYHWNKDTSPKASSIGLSNNDCNYLSTHYRNTRARLMAKRVEGPK